MSNFEKAAALPETLGTFLSSLNVATEPWDESFHRIFCDSCKQENCDVEHCPHQDTRNNPTWWLTQAAEGERETAAQTANIVVEPFPKKRTRNAEKKWNAFGVIEMVYLGDGGV